MSWKGTAIGGSIGWMLGGPLGALLGAFLGNRVETELRSNNNGNSRSSSGDRFTADSSMVFCASAAAMLAKMAKADGVVTRNEIAAVEAVFARLGFREAVREYAIRVFRKAKDDNHSIYEYASEFAMAVKSVEVREVFYGMLWELARADGVVGPAERRILHDIPRALRIRQGWFNVYDSGESESESRDSLISAYETLGVASSATDDAVRKAYREKAKKYHPDALRAQGLPEEMVGKATEQMARVNAAWETIKKSRKI